MPTSRRNAQHQGQTRLQFRDIQREAVTPDELEAVRRKITAAAYTLGGQDVQALFNKIDKDHSGGLDEEEFISMVRRALKLPPTTITDGQVAAVFRAIDVDNSGTIEVEELVAFAGNDGRAETASHTSGPAKNGHEAAVQLLSIATSKVCEQKSREGAKMKSFPEKSTSRGTSTSQTQLPSSTATLAAGTAPADVDNVRNKLLAATYIAGASDFGSLLREIPQEKSGQIEVTALINVVRSKLRIPSTILDDEGFFKLVDYLGGSGNSIQVEHLVIFMRGDSKGPLAEESSYEAKVPYGSSGQRKRISAEDLLDAADAAAASNAVVSVAVENSLSTAPSDSKEAEFQGSSVGVPPYENKGASNPGVNQSPDLDEQSVEFSDWKDVLSKQIADIESESNNESTIEMTGSSGKSSVEVSHTFT